MSDKAHPETFEETEFDQPEETGGSEELIAPANLRKFSEEELEWAYLMLALMGPSAAASAFLMSFPEIVEIEHGNGDIEIADKAAAKARIVERFNNLKYMPNRRASREIQENKKLKDRIQDFNKKFDTTFIKFEELIYFSELMEMAESAESNQERFKYLKEAWRVYGSHDSKQHLDPLGYSAGNVDVVGDDE